MIQQSLFAPPVDVGLLREVAEVQKQRGMTLASDATAEAVAVGQVALLRALLESTDGTATIDDATDDLTQRFERGGKWRGSIPSASSRRGIIERIGDAKSDRPTRHRGYVSVWRITDRDKAQREIERLTGWLSAAEKKDPLSAGTDAGKDSDNLTTQSSKESSDETI